MGFGIARVDKTGTVMSGKVAFCFPGQGSLEAGMAREIAESFPESLAVLEAGSRAAGLDLIRLTFEAPESELVETEVQQPALVATSLAVLAAVKDAVRRCAVVCGGPRQRLGASRQDYCTCRYRFHRWPVDAIRLDHIRPRAIRRSCRRPSARAR